MGGRRFQLTDQQLVDVANRGERLAYVEIVRLFDLLGEPHASRTTIWKECQAIKKKIGEILRDDTTDIGTEWTDFSCISLSSRRRGASGAAPAFQTEITTKGGATT